MSHQVGLGPKTVNRSCRCRQCRYASPAVRADHKRQGWHKIRRMTRAALRRGDWDNAMPQVSTGYKA